MVSVGGWTAEQLTAFLAGLSSFTDEESALSGGLERIAEAVEAEITVVVGPAGVLASVGFGRQTPPEQLLEITPGTCRVLNLPDVGGRYAVLGVRCEVTPHGVLVVARRGEPTFDSDERNLLRGMSQALGLAVSNLRRLASERRMRVESDQRAADNAELLARLRDRQQLLERLSGIQRAICARAPVDDVLGAIVTGAAELLGDAGAGLRRIDPHDPTTTELIRSAGVTDDLRSLIRRAGVAEGVAGRAIAARHLVVDEAYGREPNTLEAFLADKIRSAMAAPVFEGSQVVGALVVGSHLPGRGYGPSEQDTLLAFADHASLALTDHCTVRELRTALDTARHDALHDPLTGLPNRALLRDRVDQALRRREPQGGLTALALMDLDGFKGVNDSLGHDAGDRLLVAVAERLRAALRPGETLARLGGDEFAVLVEDVESAVAAERVADRLLVELAAPFSVANHELKINASIGVAISAEPDETPRDLLRNADLAMYKAKASGKGRHARYYPGLYIETLTRLETETALREALEADQFVLRYQPIVRLADGVIRHVEALIRWQRPGRPLVSPAEFIAVAEASGLIAPIGDWVLRRACTDTLGWQAHPDLDLSVNLSPVQVAPGFPDRLAGILSETGFPAHRLILEITESLLMDDTPDTLAVLAAVQALGVRLAIDDFGTGYSSLSRLHTLRVDQLKIDKSFIDQLAGSGGAMTVVGGVVALGHGLGMTVVAEGVETPEQCELLLGQACHEAQGYLFARPLATDEIAHLPAALPRGTGSAACSGGGDPVVDLVPQPVDEAVYPCPRAGGTSGAHRHLVRARVPAVQPRAELAE